MTTVTVAALVEQYRNRQDPPVPLTVVARRGKISRQHLYSLRDGAQRPGLRIRFRLAKLFKVSKKTLDLAVANTAKRRKR
jgi:hypothetical protein